MIRGLRKPIPGPKVGSLWSCDACADNLERTEIITTPGGPAPRCKKHNHGFMRYRGGKYISDGVRPVEVPVEKDHDKE